MLGRPLIGSNTFIWCFFNRDKYNLCKKKHLAGSLRLAMQLFQDALNPWRPQCGETTSDLVAHAPSQGNGTKDLTQSVQGQFFLSSLAILQRGAGCGAAILEADDQSYFHENI